MPGANKMTTPVAVDLPEIEGRYAEAGEYTIGFESFPQDVDPAPFFRGLPDNRCQCPHWGVVTSGQITFRYADHEETYGVGDAYYASPGHLPLLAAGTSVTEFSRTADLNATMAVVEQNLAGAS
ncbi:MAG: cupin domain-containing protein [Nocardioides sp.]